MLIKKGRFVVAINDCRGYNKNVCACHPIICGAAGVVRQKAKRSWSGFIRG
jgi:hypothetical protein